MAAGKETAQITTYVARDLALAVTELAATDGVTVSQWVRRLIIAEWKRRT